MIRSRATHPDRLRHVRGEIAHVTPFTRALATATQGLAWLVLALVLAILIEWAGKLLGWPDQGAAHSRALLAREVEHLDRDFRKSLLTSNPAQFGATPLVWTVDRFRSEGASGTELV